LGAQGVEIRQARLTLRPSLPDRPSYRDPQKASTFSGVAGDFIMPSNAKPVWFITGCSTGFGREMAQMLLGGGYRVVVTARDKAKVGAGASRGDPFL